MSLSTTLFGSVCHLVNGKAFKPTDWSRAGIPIIRIQNLNGSDKPFNFWAGALDEQVCVKEGDLLLAWSGTPGTSFGAHIWNGPDGVLNQHIFRCDLEQKTITKEWAKIAINHRLHRLIEQAHGGVGLQHVTRGMVEDLEIPLPPLPEQRRIAEVLDRAEALRAKRRAALAQLDSLTQSIFLDLFGDPATNPKSWPCKPVGSLACKFSDGPFGSNLKSEHYTETGVRVIRLQNIGVGEFVDDDAAYISEHHFAKLKKHECRPGDVLVGTLGDPNLRACIQPEWLPSALNKADCVQIRPDEGVANAIYICALLNQPATESMAQDLMHGQTRVRISMGRLRGLEVPVPPIELQREFARRVKAVEKLKAAQRASLAELDALFASLQHRAFRGEL